MDELQELPAPERGTRVGTTTERQPKLIDDVHSVNFGPGEGLFLRSSYSHDFTMEQVERFDFSA